MISPDTTPEMVRSTGYDERFCDSVRELLRFAVDRLKVKFAVARLDGTEPIASDPAAPLREEESLANEATVREALTLAQIRPNAPVVKFYAAARLIDSKGTFRGTIGVMDDRVQRLSPDNREVLISIARMLTGLLEQHDLAENRKEEAEQFRALVEEAAVAVYSIRNGRLSYVNNKFAEFLGYTREEILALDSFADLIVEGQRAQVLEMVRRRAEGESREIRYRTRVRRRDGTLLDAEIHGSVADVSGDRLVIGTAFDVTDSVSADELLRQREKYFRLLTDNLPDIILIVGADGRLNYISAAIENVLGYKVEERLGKNAFDTIHPEDRDRLSSLLQVLSSGGAIDRAQFRFRHKNGSWRLLELHGTNLLHDPQVRGLIVNASDVTDRRRLEQELEQLNRLSSLGRLAAQMAHEFNNVMMGIQPAVDVLRRTASENPEISRLADLISSSMSRGKRITSDILRFGRPAQLSLRPVSIEELFSQAAAEIRPLLSPGTSLSLALPESQLFIHGDRLQLAQILINLALNARDAMTAGGGTLTIGARPGSEHTAHAVAAIPNSEEFIHINVTDTGEGIRSENLPYIFEPLFTTKRTGTGLGLSVVYQVVTGHGGHIFVETRREHGTTFHLFIPREPVRRAEAEEERREVPASLQKLRVLIVEDEVSVATGLRWVLEAEGMTAHVVGRAADVIPAIDDFKPDVVLLDLSLPDDDGRAVYERVSERSLPVIFSTGSPGTRDLAESGHGGVTVLMKPYTADDLLRAIYEVLSPGGVQ